MLGFLNINKPKGMTSHDVISHLRHVLNIKQIGHTGTLDPFAEGVLIIGIGKATRLFEYLNEDKVYIATIQFGSSTTTYDIEGEIVETTDKKVNEEDFINILEKFKGEIEQIPPIYSAIKVDGKKLYEYAREGKNVEIKPRSVKIYEIKPLKFDYEKQQAIIYVSCSKGTYIRTIGYDIGKELNNVAHLIELKRVQAGSFKIENSVKSGDLKTKEDVVKCLKEPLKYLPLANVEINDIELKRVINGLQIYPRENISGNVVLCYKNKIVAIAEADEKKIKAHKVVYEN